jgi:hypothetical protein
MADYQELPDNDEFDPGYKGLPDEDEFGGYVWMKYNHKWAHGCGEEPHYRELNSEWELEDGNPNEEVLEEIASEFGYSDKYRGIDYEIIPAPPKEYINKEIEGCNSRIASLKDRIERLTQLRDQHGGNL